MTVGTCLDHPHLGKTQLFRRNVDFTTLYEIFSNPRVHTNKGYHNADKRRKISSVSSSSFDSSISSSRSGTDSDGCIYPEGISEIPSNLRSNTSPYLLKVIRQDGISVREGVELDSKFIDNIPYGTFISAQEKSFTYDNLPRYRVSTGWVPEYASVKSGIPERCCKLIKSKPATNEKEFILAHIRYLEREITYTKDRLQEMAVEEEEEAERRRLVKEEAERRRKEEEERKRKEAAEAILKGFFRHHEEAQRERQIKMKKRGENIYWELRHSTHIPNDMEDVRSIALAEGGYIAISDNGSSCYHGVPTIIIDQITRHQNKNLELIAIGPRDYSQYNDDDYFYYLLKTNGRQFGNVSSEFWETMNSRDASPEFVAIAGPDSYYIKFDDGASAWNGLNESCTAILLRRGVTVKCIWIGPDDAYFLNYREGGEKKRSYYKLPGALNKYASNKRYDVRKMCFDYYNDGYFVSYNLV